LKRNELFRKRFNIKVNQTDYTTAVRKNRMVKWYPSNSRSFLRRGYLKYVNLLVDAGKTEEAKRLKRLELKTQKILH
jgi:hypothetical protein